MKRAFVVLFALLSFALYACGSAEDKKEEEISISDYGIGDVVAGAGLDRDCVYSSFNEEQRTSLVDYAKTIGVEVSFTEEGTTVFVFAGENGNVVKQYKDGKVAVSLTEDDASAGLQSDWPQNDYTAKLPVPPFKVVSVSDLGGSFTVTFEAFDKEGAASYTEELKKAGFTVDASVTDVGDTYIYTAKNAHGDTVSLYTPSLLILTLGK